MTIRPWRGEGVREGCAHETWKLGPIHNHKIITIAPGTDIYTEPAWIPTPPHIPAPRSEGEIATPLQRGKTKGLVTSLYLTSSLGMQLATLRSSWEVADLWSRTLSRLHGQQLLYSSPLLPLLLHLCLTTPVLCQPLPVVVIWYALIG